MGVGGLFKDFSGWTSSHGIPQIGGASTICVRLIWIFIFIGSLGIFGQQCYEIVKKFYSYPITVSIDVKFEERDFPAITICGLNPYKYSTLHLAPELQDLISQYEIAVKDPYTTATTAKWGLNALNSTWRVQAQAMKDLIFVGNGLSEEIRNNMTYDLSELVLECSYQEEACDLENDFMKLMDPIYGACYQFNHEYNPKVKYTNTRSGPLNGFRIVLKTMQDSFVKMTEVNGARITVHKQHQTPFPDAFGYNAAAGYTNTYSVRMTRMTRLPFPYGDCTEEKPTDSTFYYATNYSQEGCYRSCIQDQIIAKCKCADPRFGYPSGTPLCAIEDLGCADTFTVSQRDDASVDLLESCSCPQSCTETLLGVVTGSALQPPLNTYPEECEEWTAGSGSIHASKDACHEWYEQNTLSVEVFYERMTYTELIESPAYTFYDALLTFGGQLGLWQGASVITVIEFFALGIIIATYCCGKNKAPKIDDIVMDEDEAYDNDEPEDDKEEDKDNKKESDKDGSSSSSSSSDSSSDSEDSSEDESIDPYGAAGSGDTPVPPPSLPEPV